MGCVDLLGTIQLLKCWTLSLCLLYYIDFWVVLASYHSHHRKHFKKIWLESHSWYPLVISAPTDPDPLIQGPVPPPHQQLGIVHPLYE